MSPRPDPTARFSDRADDYVRGRPGYPEVLFDELLARTGLGAGAAVADLGAGTGLSSEPFLRRGLAVFAVEPNAAMRAAAARWLGDRPGFTAVDGRAEASGLAAASVDLVFAAQAFHWFDGERARVEARRILRPAGALALAWNARRAGGSPFLAGYEALLERFGTDYRQVNHRGLAPERLAAYFGGPFSATLFSNAQRLDLAGLRARLLSSSYTPPPGHGDHSPMLAELERLFAACAVAGEVEIVYDCTLYLGG